MPFRYLLILSLAALLAACSQPTPPTPYACCRHPAARHCQPARRPRAGSGQGGSQTANLAFTTSGQVRTVNVAVGDTVKQGDTLVALDSTAVDAGVVEAQAALFRAQANLDELKAGPRVQEVTAARATVRAARRGSTNSLTPRAKVTSPPRDPR